MRSSAVLSVAFVTAAVTVAPVIAVPTLFHDIPKPMAGASVDASLGPHKREPWSPNYGIGPVLVPGFCSETGACERGLQSRAAAAMDDTVQHGTLTQAEANKIIQLLQSSEGIQFLQALEADTAALHAPGHTNGTANHTVSHTTRSSKTAVAGTVFGGIGALSTLGNVIASNFFPHKGSKRSIPIFSESVPYYDFTAPEHAVRGVSDDAEDLVARNFAGQEAGSVFDTLARLSGEKREPLEESDILRRTWLDDLVQYLDHVAVTGP